MSFLQPRSPRINNVLDNPPAAGGNVFTQSLTGSLSFIGGVQNSISKLMTSSLSFVGAGPLRAITKGMTASLSFVGALKRAINTGLVAATLNFSGALTKKLTRSLTAGSLSFVGAFAKQINKPLTGSLSFSGAFTKLLNKSTFTASLTFVGSFAKLPRKVIAGSLSFIGSQARFVSKQLTAASLSFVGSNLRAITKKLTAASLSFVGAIVKVTVKSPFTGALSFIGNFAKGALHFSPLTSSLSFVGAITKLPNKALSATLTFNGNKNYALLFSGGSNGYVSAPYTFPTDTFSVFFRYRTNKIFGNAEGWFSQSGSISIGRQGLNSVEVYAYLNASADFAGPRRLRIHQSSEFPITDNQWHTRTYVIYVNGSNHGAVDSYEDGVFLSTHTTNFTGDTSTPSGNLALGSLNFSSGLTFSGEMDDIVIINRTATATEITDYNSRGAIPTTPGAIWQFNEGSGTSTADGSGNGNTGTLTGSALPVWIEVLPVLIKTINHSLAASLSFVGSLNKLLSRSITGSLSFVGVSARQTGKVFTAALSLIVDSPFIYNANFEIAPAFTAVQTTSGNWIDGTATGSATNALSGWRANIQNASAQFDNSTSHGGTYSLKSSTTSNGGIVEIKDAAGYNTLGSDQYRITLSPNTQYTLTYWMKTNYVSGDSNNGAFASFLGASPDGANITNHFGTQIKTTTGWTQYTTIFTTASNEIYGHIELRIYGHTGTANLIMDAWWDDISLVPTVAYTGFTKQINHKISGALTFSGAILRSIAHGMSGSLSFVGSLAKRIAHSFTGSLSFVGTSIRSTLKSLLAAIWPSGGDIVNLIANPSFEVDLSGWQNGGLSLSRDATFGNVFGSASAKFQTDGTFQSFLWQTTIPVNTGVKYTASAYVTTTAPHTPNGAGSNQTHAIIYCYWQGSGMSPTEQVWTGADVDLATIRTGFRIAGTLTAPRGATAATYYIYQYGVGTAWWDGMQVEVGDTAHQYIDGSIAPARWYGTANASFSYQALLVKTINHGFSGSLSFVGALARSISKQVSSALSFVGSLTKQLSRSLTGAVSFSGSIARRVNKSFTGSLSFVGNLARNISHGVTASLSFIGNLATTSFRHVSFTAGLSFVGSFARRSNKGLTASLSFSGSITRRIFKTVSGALSFSGALARSIRHGLTGALSFSGTISRTIFHSLAGSLSFSGAFAKRIGRSLTAALSFSGSFTKASMFTRSFTASVGFSGTLIKTTARSFTAALSYVGNLVKRYIPIPPPIPSKRTEMTQMDSVEDLVTLSSYDAPTQMDTITQIKKGQTTSELTEQDNTTIISNE